MNARTGVLVAAVVAAITACNQQTTPQTRDANENAIDTTVHLSAILTGAAETLTGAMDGSGSAMITLNPQTNEVCAALAVAGIAPATAAHIHHAPAGQAGPVVIPLTAPTNGTSESCTTADAALIADITAHPGDYYANVHNAAHPGGALRGQLHPAVTGGTGTLKVRKIYDYTGDRAGTPYAAHDLNGAYDYPEPIIGGWPVTITPIDLDGHEGTPIATTTLHETSPTDGRYLELPAGRYRIHELTPAGTTGGGTWTQTGSNATTNGTTTATGKTTTVFIDVLPGTTHTNATVARFLNACQVQGQTQTLPAEAVTNVTTAAWPCGPDFGTTIAAGLTGPMGVLVAPDHTVYAIDSGLGTGMTPTAALRAALAPRLRPLDLATSDTAHVIKVTPDGAQSTIATLPSMNSPEGGGLGGARLALVNGHLYATNGGFNEDIQGARPDKIAAIVDVHDGTSTEIANTWDLENATNPDGTLRDSHPYDLTPTPDGHLYVADAGANDILHVNPATGEVHLVAVLPPQPAPFPNPEYGGQQLVDAVPTGIVIAANGDLLVSTLPGALLPDAAKVLRVTTGGQVSEYATGLNLITDLTAGPDGQLYAVQIGRFGDMGPIPNSGAIIRVKPGANHSETVLGGLSFPTSVDFDANGNAFVTINGLGAPGSGQVVMYPALTTAPGAM